MHNDDGYVDTERMDMHSITLKGDASHLSAISADSRTLSSSGRTKSPLSVLQEGDDSSFFSSSRRGSVDSPASRSSRSRYKEVKDDEESTSMSSRRHSVEPEGEYQPEQRSAVDGRCENAARARKEALDRYSSVARKKATLMTKHNFERGDTSSRDEGSRSGDSIRSRDEPESKSPPPLPFSDQGTFVGHCISPDDASSVSSMTSMDSYMKQQYILREIERLRERESRVHIDSSRGSRRHDDGKQRFYNDNARPKSEHLRESRMSRSAPRDRSRRRSSDLESIWEQDSGHSRSRHSSSRNECDNYKPFKSCAQSHSTSHTPPLSQIEECCIKHPHILLSDQSDVNIWTCMRYCKDERTGRWVTKKKVCEVCLKEDAEMAYHRQNEKPSHGKEHFEERTHSMSSSEDNENQYRNTVNVYTDDGNQTPLEREAEAQRRRFIRRLAARAYHFPGNTWCEDWTQYIANTHIVFGIFFHHSLHPVTSRERCIILLGSVAVGLLMSNLIYLWFLHENFGMNDVILHIEPGLDITKLMITLWTLGSFVHTIFDLSVWHIKACTLCRYGGEVSDTAVKCGRRSGITIVMVTLAFATYLCLVRASRDAQAAITASEGGLHSDDDIEDTFFHPVTLAGSRKSFIFLFGYIIEFILAAFVYGPIMLTVVFTGVLGCNGRIPILGGRPREMAKEQRYAMKRQRYIMPRTLKLGDEEFEADMWGDEELMTKF